MSLDTLTKDLNFFVSAPTGLQHEVWIRTFSRPSQCLITTLKMKTFTRNEIEQGPKHSMKKVYFDVNPKKARVFESKRRFQKKQVNETIYRKKMKLVFEISKKVYFDVYPKKARFPS